MKRTFTLFLFFLTSIYFAHSQKNFKPGYIVTNTLDTIQGLVDYRVEGENAIACRFKVSENEKEQLFLPGQITGFHFTNEKTYYVSKTFVIKNTESTVFLEYLYKGAMNLYYFKDNRELFTYYLFEDEKGKIVPITNNYGDKKTSDDGKAVAENRNKAVLKYVFRNCEPLFKQIERTQFRHDDMIRLVKEYNILCGGQEKHYEFETGMDKRRVKMEFSAYGGLDLTTFPTTYFHRNFHRSMKGTSPMIGGQLNVSAPKWKKSISFLVDLSLTRMNTGNVDVTNNWIPVYDIAGYTANNLTFNYQAYRILNLIGFRFALPTGRFRPIFEAGTLGDYSFQEKEHLYIKYVNQETTETIIRHRITDGNHFPTMYYFTGFYASLGLDYNLGNDHYLLFRVSQVNFQEMDSFQFKMGYTF